MAAAVFLLHFLLARFGMLFLSAPGGIAAVWPAAGFQLAVLILAGKDRRVWALGAVFLANIAARLASDVPLPAAAGFAVANLLEGYVAIRILDRFASPEIRFTSLRDTRVFLLLVAGIGNAFTSLAGAAVSRIAAGTDFWVAWKTWFLADACGMLLVAPFLVEWATDGMARLRSPDYRRLTEGAAAFLLLVALYYLHVYPAEGTDRIHNTYVLFPFLVWITVRLGTPGTVTGNLCVALLIGFHGLRHRMAMDLPAGDLVEQGQIFTTITSGTTLFLSAVFSERGRARKELLLLNESLERQVRERTRAAEEKARRLLESDRANRRLVEDLKASNDELDAFSWSVSHDLRAPLRAVAGFGLALQEDCGERLGERGASYLARMREAVARMESLIDGLMALARVSRSEIRRIGMDLAPVAREVAADLADRQPSRRVAFRVPGHVPVQADPRLLRLLLENLLGNAWKFTARNPEAVVEFEVAGDDARPLYFVRDNGVGFDMAFAGEMFSPFRRLHPDEEFAGTGIGLATVRRIVSRHGGMIWAEGKPGEGATVYFTLQGGDDDMDTGRGDP